MQEKLTKLLGKQLNDPQLKKLTILQSLWSGYGEISRYFSPALNKTIIVKQVTPPTHINHPRGWNTDEGHQRKVQSYRIEAAFYQSFASLCNDTCYVPQYIAFINHSDKNEQQLLVMEDLNALGFSHVYQKVNASQVRSVICWLAQYHARFLAVDTSQLWPVGTYWHLATRKAEFQKMGEGQLKQNARQIAHRLENARFLTLLHGDAKLANFCFDSSDEVAAVDFQYVGRGVGVKDVMYFLGSCLSDNQLKAEHDIYIEFYFTQLKNALLQQKFEQYSELENEWRSLIPFAWADFNRFLQGWSPEHVKINRFMHMQTALANNHLFSI